MDLRTMVVWIVALVAVTGGIFWATNASVEKTRLQTDATIARAQEHTRRAEGRHDTVDVLGWLRGWKAQRERNETK